MPLRLRRCQVRSWRQSDAPSLAKHANNRNVSRNLRDRFPYPYTVDDAHEFIEQSVAADPQTAFAIVVDGRAVGGVGFTLRGGAEPLSAELGYWLGEKYWGRGIMTDVVRAVTQYAIEAHGLTRVCATHFDWNAASGRVLEKAGFVFEGRLRRSIIKDGQMVDQLLYAYVC